MPGPLNGVRIIDLTTMISGPFATMLLGDQGADVIKVERPGGGDQMRRYGERNGVLTAPFINNNRNKRSVAIDLKAPGSAEVLKRLTATADVLIQNFRPGVVEKLGIGFVQGFLFARPLPAADLEPMPGRPPEWPVPDEKPSRTQVEPSGSVLPSRRMQVPS